MSMYKISSNCAINYRCLFFDNYTLLQGNKNNKESTNCRDSGKRLVGEKTVWYLLCFAVEVLNKNTVFLQYFEFKKQIVNVIFLRWKSSMKIEEKH